MQAQANDILFMRKTWCYEDVPIFFPTNTDTKKKRPRRTPLDKNIPQMVTIKRLAELTGLSEYCIRGLCKRNEITTVHTGTKILINYDRFIDYLNGIL